MRSTRNLATSDTYDQLPALFMPSDEPLHLTQWINGARPQAVVAHIHHTAMVPQLATHEIAAYLRTFADLIDPPSASTVDDMRCECSSIHPTTTVWKLLPHEEDMLRTVETMYELRDREQVIDFLENAPRVLACLWDIPSKLLPALPEHAALAVDVSSVGPKRYDILTVWVRCSDDVLDSLDDLLAAIGLDVCSATQGRLTIVPEFSE